MMKLGKAAVSWLLVVFFMAGCMKAEDVRMAIGPSGKGGIAVIKATPLHGVVLVDSCMIYIKYNTTSQPINNVYDDSARCIPEAGKPVAIFTQLKPGYYYLYGKGWDGKAVKGGTGWLISDTISTNAITIPVDN
jgi:hypothetical protein